MESSLMKMKDSFENLVTRPVTSAALSSGSLLFSLAASTSYTSYS